MGVHLAETFVTLDVHALAEFGRDGIALLLGPAVALLLADVYKRQIKNRGKKPSPSVKEAAENGAPQNMQLSMFQLDDPVLVQIRDQIKGLDINSLTPIEALNKLNEIKKITGI